MEVTSETRFRKRSFTEKPFTKGKGHSGRDWTGKGATIRYRGGGGGGGAWGFLPGHSYLFHTRD